MCIALTSKMMVAVLMAIEKEFIIPDNATFPPYFSVNTGIIAAIGPNTWITSTCRASNGNGAKKQRTNASKQANARHDKIPRETHRNDPYEGRIKGKIEKTCNHCCGKSNIERDFRNEHIISRFEKNHPLQRIAEHDDTNEPKRLGQHLKHTLFPLLPRTVFPEPALCFPIFPVFWKVIVFLLHHTHQGEQQLVSK